MDDMFEFDMARDHGCALLSIDGDILGYDDAEALAEVLGFIHPVEHLVLDMTNVAAIDDPAAEVLYRDIRERSIHSDVVIVSPGETVSMPLVLRDVDRVSAIVRRRDQAIALLRCAVSPVFAGEQVD